MINLSILSKKGRGRLRTAAPHAQALRAIAIEFLVRTYKPLAITIIVLGAVLLAIAISLVVFVSQWFWILLIPVLVICIVLVGVLIVVRLLLKHMRPPQTGQQRAEVSSFVDNLQ